MSRGLSNNNSTWTTLMNIRIDVIRAGAGDNPAGGDLVLDDGGTLTSARGNVGVVVGGNILYSVSAVVLLAKLPLQSVNV